MPIRRSRSGAAGGRKGTTFFANNPYGIRLAAEIVDAVACSEKVRFVSSGSEADLYPCASRAPTLGATRS